jgi:hypothetical protein
MLPITVVQECNITLSRTAFTLFQMFVDPQYDYPQACNFLLRKIWKVVTAPEPAAPYAEYVFTTDCLHRIRLET